MTPSDEIEQLHRLLREAHQTLDGYMLLAALLYGPSDYEIREEQNGEWKDIKSEYYTIDIRVLREYDLERILNHAKLFRDDLIARAKAGMAPGGPGGA